MLAFLVALAIMTVGAMGRLVAQDNRRPNEAAREPPTEQAPPTSFELIDRALAAKQITEEKAYVYRVFAAFGDSRLPDRFRGVNGSLSEPPPVVIEAGKRLRTFSPETQAELAPFFKRPTTPGSWFTLPTVKRQETATPPREGSGAQEADAGATEPNEPLGDGDAAAAHAGTRQRDDWFSVRAAGGKVKVWAHRGYDGDSLKAEQVARAVTSTIWPRLVGLFWEPLDDGYILLDNGGGPELDIYLVRVDFSDANAAWRQQQFRTTASWKGLAQWADWSTRCEKSPRYLLIDSRRPIGGPREVGMVQVVAHELMHAITFSKALKHDSNCREYDWISEATATWSEDWTYPQANSEHDRAPHFLREPMESLDKVSAIENDPRHYGAYLFPFHLASQGKHQALPKMWTNFATSDVLEGIDAALRVETGKTLEKTWPEFALQNWNQPSVDDYKQSDGLTAIARRTDFVNLVIPQGSTTVERRIFTGIRYLAARYSHVEIDANTRTVTFEHFLHAFPFATVWIIEKIKGTWQKPIDFTESSFKSWCRDVDEEDLEALVIIITNNQWQDKQRRVNSAPNDPKVKGFRNGCPGWNGTTTTVNTITSRDPAMTIVETVTSSLRFAIDSAAIIAGQPVEYWKLVSGQLSWRVQVTGVCTGQAGGTLGVRDYGPGDELAKLHIWNDGGTLRYANLNGPWPGDIPSYDIVCPTGPPTRMVLFAALGWFNSEVDNNLVSADGKSISGAFTSTQGDAIKTTYRFSFRASSR